MTEKNENRALSVHQNWEEWTAETETRKKTSNERSDADHDTNHHPNLNPQSVLRYSSATSHEIFHPSH